MRKVFLSHSSKDKIFVEKVANVLGKDYCVYDAYTFESGMKTLDEIYKNLEESNIFVIFLSDNALNSSWVREEYEKAEELEQKGKLQKIFPFIIDKKINYKDIRIPKRLKEYNLKLVASPKLAASKIKACMLDVEWRQNPSLYMRNTLFLGRNKEIQEFEERRADIDHGLKGLIASSAFEGIGRKAYMRHVLVKDNLMSASLRPNIISLERHQSIEDFILKIAELGYREISSVELVGLSMEVKIDTAVEIIKIVQEQHSFIFIEDDGVIVKPNQTLTEWFKNVLDRMTDGIVFCLASSFSLPERRAGDNLFSIKIPELSKLERSLLLADFSKNEGLDLSKEQLKLIATNLSGYPEQIFYVVQMIKDEGIERTLENLSEIRAYSDDRAELVLKKYVDTDEKVKFLAFISAFDFLNMKLLDCVYREFSDYKKIMDTFLSVSICEFIGANGEYIKVNDVLKDVVFRRRLSMGDRLHKLYILVLDYVVNEEFIKKADLAEFYNVVQRKLEKECNNGRYDEKYIVPSQYLRCIIDQYNMGKYESAELLCKMLIENGRMSNFDREIVRQIKYYYCQTLARLHKRECLEWADSYEFEDSDKFFLKGFYYRITRQPEKAIYQLTLAISKRSNFSRAKRELANAYLICEEYDKARTICEDNYNEDRRNPYFIQPYFETEIHQKKDERNIVLLERLLKEMKSVGTEQAEQMFDCMKVEYEAYVENNYEKARMSLECALKKDKSKIYLKLRMFDIAFYFSKSEDIKKSIMVLKNDIDEDSYFYLARIAREIKYYGFNKNSIKVKELCALLDKLKGIDSYKS